MAKNKKTKTGNVKEASAVLPKANQRNNSDINGSYTGTPAAGGRPDQDADDL